MADGPASADARSADERARAVAEARWHMAAAVVAAIVLTALMPDDVRLGPNWLLPAVEAVLLVALIVADPAKISRRSTLLRTLSIVLVLGGTLTILRLPVAQFPKIAPPEIQILATYVGA